MGAKTSREPTRFDAHALGRRGIAQRLCFAAGFRLGSYFTAHVLAPFVSVTSAPGGPFRLNFSWA